jgi:hypothetical protein
MNPLTVCPCCGQPVRGISASALAHLDVTESERAVLNAFVRRFPAAMHLDSLAQVLWGASPSGGPVTAENVMRVHIHNLNKKLAKSGFKIALAGKRMRALRRVSPIINTPPSVGDDFRAKSLNPKARASLMPEATF